MITYINLILDFFIKLSVTLGIFFLISKYFRVKKIDKEIKKYNEKFEKVRNNYPLVFVKRSSPATSSAYDSTNEDIVKELEQKRDLEINPLQKERDNIISIIPFLK
ncbi:MAG: hypothetical protein Q8R17_02105 [bacterium]|nr:hypothetical protein [bacterium]